MKLIKQEIQFIDNYLIKNEVKFWDVRIELLDHIVSAVEDRIETEGISFNEALLNVHRGFGNQLITDSIPATEIFEKGLYQSNIGFKKFQRQKQKELSKKIRRFFRLEILNAFSKISFYLEFAVVVSVLILTNVFSYGHLAFGLMMLYFLAFLFVVGHVVYNKVDKHSLTLNSIYMLGFSILSLINMVLQLFSINDEPAQSTVYLATLIVLILVYPLIRANIVLYRRYFTKFKNDYKFYNVKRN